MIPPFLKDIQKSNQQAQRLNSGILLATLSETLGSSNIRKMGHSIINDWNCHLLVADIVIWKGCFKQFCLPHMYILCFVLSVNCVLHLSNRDRYSFVGYHIIPHWTAYTKKGFSGNQSGLAPFQSIAEYLYLIYV